MTKHTCQGKRLQFRKNTRGVFRCMRKATASVETHVGLTQTHYVCDDPECYASIACGYPATVQPLTK